MTAPIRTGALLVVSGPSGVGKDTLLARVLRDVPRLVRSVSATTRAMRPGEVEGADYHFQTREQFEDGVRRGAFLEWATYGGNLYGTPKDWVSAERAAGFDVVLKIEVKGALEVRRIVPDAVLIFVAPPSLDDLDRRLRNRASETEESISVRLETARTEMATIPQYDYVVVNDQIERAAQSLGCIVHALRHRIVP